MKILVADDDENVCGSLMLLLGTLYGRENVVGVESAEAAWERIVGGEGFDLIISDVDMLVMSGAELSIKIRERDPNAKILLISRNTEPPRHKASAFMKKPLESGAFLDKVGELLEVE